MQVRSLLGVQKAWCGADPGIGVRFLSGAQNKVSLLGIFYFVLRNRTGRGRETVVSPACRQAGVAELLKPMGLRELFNIYLC